MLHSFPTDVHKIKHLFMTFIHGAGSNAVGRNGFYVLYELCPIERENLSLLLFNPFMPVGSQERPDHVIDACLPKTYLMETC